MLVASHESGGDRGRSECKDKTVTHQVPRHRGEERDGHKKHRGSHSGESQSSGRCVPEASRIQDFQNVDTATLGGQREPREQEIAFGIRDAEVSLKPRCGFGEDVLA